MILTDEQQRWCTEHHLGWGFDDDAEDKVQYKHVCEFVGGDGDAPRPRLARHVTRRKLARLRRARNAWARRLALTSVRTAYDERLVEIEAPQFVDTALPHRHRPLCDGCYAWIGGRGHHVMSDVYAGMLRYCRACCDSGVSERDYERRAAAKERLKQPLAYEPQTSVALCRSPRLWCGSADQPWPALDADATVEERAKLSENWADITCVDCLRTLNERGCP